MKYSIDMDFLWSMPFDALLKLAFLDNFVVICRLWPVYLMLALVFLIFTIFPVILNYYENKRQDKLLAAHLKKRKEGEKKAKDKNEKNEGWWG